MNAIAEGKSKLGELDFKIAAAACYLPVMYVHLIASLAFLAIEPRENRPVRFHAGQSLLISAGWLGGTFLMLFVWVIAPMVLMMGGIVVGEAVGSEAVIALGMAFAGLVYFLALILVFVILLAGPVLLVGCMLFTATGKDVRVPVLASLVDRLVP